MPAQTDAIAVRQLHLGEDSRIAGLFARAFGGAPMDKALYDWKYRQNPGGPSIEVIAEDGEKTVGFYGMQARDFRLPDGTHIPTFQETDLMVDPAYRGRNLFVRLNRFAYEEAARRGAPMTYGFPNSTSTPIGQAKLGWRILGTVPVWCAYLRPSTPNHPRISRLLSPAGALTSALLLGRARSITGTALVPEEVPVETFARELPAIDRRTGIGIPRSPEFSRWRFQRLDAHNYTCLRAESGYAVVRFRVERGVPELILLEAAAPDSAAMARLIAGVLGYARHAGADAVRAWSLEGTMLGAALRRLWFVPRKGPNLAVTVLRDFPQVESVLDSKSWEVTWADSDTA